MMYKIEFDDEAKKTIAKLKKSNPQTFKKVTKLLEDIALHPRTGIGHPEPLKGGANITYSRHIKGKDLVAFSRRGKGQGVSTVVNFRAAKRHHHWIGLAHRNAN